MSKISNLIFHNEYHQITSKYGPRKPIKTSNGYTSDFHKGTDYGTKGKKIAQYAAEDGVVLSTGVSNSCGNYVWIKYPRLNVKMCHYHLDKICVRKGQAVNNDILIGYTGTTGMSTGIHLHLGIYDLAKDCYVDPELYAENYAEFAENYAEFAENYAEFAENDEVINTNDNDLYTIYIVQKGDTLSEIASKYNTTYQELAEYNNIDNPNLIITGQEIKIPKEIEYFDYTVQKGDTLWALAQKYNTSVDELVKLNNIKNANLIIVGQVLKMPR